MVSKSADQEVMRAGGRDNVIILRIQLFNDSRVKKEVQKVQVSGSKTSDDCSLPEPSEQ